MTHGIVANYSGKGRKRATTFRDDTRIIRMVKQNPKLFSLFKYPKLFSLFKYFEMLRLSCI